MPSHDLKVPAIPPISAVPAKNKSSAIVAAQPPSVAIVILNWKGLDDTRACCKSLAKLTYPNARVFVVDNASGDGSAEALRSEFPQCIHVTNQKNLGFSGGNNVGIRRACAEGFQYVLLLNNDTEVAPDFLDAMVRAAEADGKIGMVGAKIYYFSNPDVIWYAGGKADFNSMATFTHRGENAADQGQFDQPGETDWVTGCCLMFRRDVVATTGVLDELFGYYCEDVDWCLRAKSAGWKIRYEPAAKVWHKVGQSASRGNLPLLYYNYRNIMLVARKNLAGRARIRYFLQALKWICGYSCHSKEKTILLEAIIHGILGRGGMATSPGTARWSNGVVHLEQKASGLKRRVKSMTHRLP